MKARHLLLVLGSLLLVAGLGWVDLLGGPRLHLAVLYLMPVIACGWWAGSTASIAVALGATFAILVSEVKWNPGDPTVAVWNTISGFLIFVVVALMISNVRAERRKMLYVNERLTSLLEQGAVGRTDLEMLVLQLRASESMIRE